MQVLDADKHAQADITPYLKIPALRPIIKSFTNDENGDFGKWASNPQVLAMLKQAKQLLDEGHMTQEELQRAFLTELEVDLLSFAKWSLPLALIGSSFKQCRIAASRRWPP